MGRRQAGGMRRKKMRQDINAMTPCELGND